MLSFLSNVITYEKPKYKLLKIKPDSKLTKTSYDNIVNVIHSLYTPSEKRISHINKGLNGEIKFETIKPVTYEILFDGANKKTTPLFYFGIEQNQSQYFKQRIQAILPNSTLTFESDNLVDLISTTFSNSYLYKYIYSKSDILSLKTSENNLLESILNVKNDLLPTEKLLFQISIKPTSDFYKGFHNEKWDKIRNGKDVTGRNNITSSLLDIVGTTADEILSIMDNVMEFQSEKKETHKNEKSLNVANFSTASKTKVNHDGFLVSIKLYVLAESELKADSYGTAFEVCLREIEDDNRLVMKKCKPRSFERGLFEKGYIMSSKEVASLVNIPNQKLQREFRIDSVNMKVNNTPRELIDTEGIRIGTDDYHGQIRTIYLPINQRNRCLSRVYLSPMGAGKSNILLNNIVDSINYGNGVVLLDHINIGEMTKAMVDIFGNRITVRNPINDSESFGFYYPELAILPTDTNEQRLDKANDVAYEVQYLINSIAVNTDNLSEIMTNYLFSACKVVFIHPNKTLLDFVNVLLDYEVRHEFIDMALDNGTLTEKSFEIKKLLEIDKDEKCIKGIMERIGTLQRDSLFQRMLNKPYNSDDSFVRYLDNKIPVSILMTNDDFPNKKKKDILCTFLLSRIRLAMSKRKNRNMVADIYIDEPQQLKKSMEIISESVYEVRKYGMSYVFAIQGINQLGILKESLLDAGCHWFMLKGCNQTTFDELKSKLNEEFDYSDMAEMEKWHSLNIISIDSKTYPFITKYPDPLKNKDGKLYIGG